MFQSILNRTNLTARQFLSGVVILVIFGGIGVFLMYYITPFGMGLVNDSTAYIGGARALLSGNGYSSLKGDWSYSPITHFPPMLSIVLSGLGLLGAEPLWSSRLVNILLFGANIILAGLFIYRMTASRLFALAGAALFLISEPLLRIHSFALSEPLYLLITSFTLWFLADYLEKPAEPFKKRWVSLAAAGLFCSIGYLTRYVGVSLYALAGAAVLFFSPSWKSRVRDGLVFLAFSVPGMAAWSLRNWLVSGNATNRPFYWHPLPQDKIDEGLRNFWGWLLPERGGLVDQHLPVLEVAILVLLGVLAVFTVVAAIGYWRKYTRLLINETDWKMTRQPNLLLILVSIYGLVYMAGLLVAMYFFDDKTIFEHRILAPFYVVILLLIIYGLAWLAKFGTTWIKKLPFNAGNVLALALVLIMALFFVEDSIDTIKLLHTSGQGFASGRWRNSETIEAVKKLPKITLFSDRITALYMLADYPAFIIPWPYYFEDGEPDETYKNVVEIYRQRVLSGDAMLVIFDYDEQVSDGNIRVIDISRDLPIYGTYTDGVIFGFDPENKGAKPLEP